MDDRRDVPVYLQRDDRGGWYTLCEHCVRNTSDPTVFTNAGYLVCVECAKEWSALVGNRYLERSQRPVPEFPADVVMPPPSGV